MDGFPPPSLKVGNAERPIGTWKDRTVATDDWRRQGQESYLAGRSVRWATWTPFRVGWDHDHCEFCHAEISDRPIDDHTEFNDGWVTADDGYHWICATCFEDFRVAFDWKVQDAPS